mgnify:CR=1 FL=1
MFDKIPGTLLTFKEGMEHNAFAPLETVLSATKGLTLGQVSEITGLAGSTVQNWIKRGWVANPKDKRYGETQVIRIILMNMLRPALSLETIAALMEYINGSVEDREDDIIPDRLLFNYLCAVIYAADKSGTTDRNELISLIENEIEDFTRDGELDKMRLQNVLLCMTLSYLSAEMKQRAETEIQKTLQSE